MAGKENQLLVEQNNLKKMTFAWCWRISQPHERPWFSRDSKTMADSEPKEPVTGEEGGDGEGGDVEAECQVDFKPLIEVRTPPPRKTRETITCQSKTAQISSGFHTRLQKVTI
jgi:hypothetical protein